jgi:hypothetical protein
MGIAEMRDGVPDPEETLKLLDRLVSLKLLDEPRFRGMHHFGGSMSGFRSYCHTIKSFRPNGANHRLHEELQNLLDGHERRSHRV